MESRARIIDAAIGCLETMGFTHTSISAVAERASVSRPTVYAHFHTRDDLISAALEKVAIDLVQRVLAEVDNADSAADYVVSLTVAVWRELRASPLMGLLTRPTAHGSFYAQDALSPQYIALAGQFLAPLVARYPSVADDLDEITETMIRCVLSLVMFESPRTASEERLRGFLHARLVPALGL